MSGAHAHFEASGSVRTKPSKHGIWSVSVAAVRRLIGGFRKNPPARGYFLQIGSV